MTFVIGIVCMLVGAATIAMGVHEVINGATGVNYMREWTGMSQTDYERLYLFLNISSSVCVIVGDLIGTLSKAQAKVSGREKSCRGSSCSIAGRLVMTAAGLKPIEEIEVGDEVLAYDEETGEQAYKPVTRLFRNTTEAWYHVRVDGEEIVCTGGHPFYILNADNNRNILEFEGVKASGTGKWICARDLKKSDKVLLSDGTCAIIESIEVETLSTPETTYNFEVADYHTYYVSDSKVLVHNECPFDPKQNADYYVKYKANGRVYTAYHQASGKYKNMFIAIDDFGHGGSSFKLLKEVAGKKLKLIGDLAPDGTYMTMKHSSNAMKTYEYYGGGRL